MASLALHGLMQGSQRIPDKAFEKIPFAGPRYFKEKEERGKRPRDGKVAATDETEDVSSGMIHNQIQIPTIPSREVNTKEIRSRAGHIAVVSGKGDVVIVVVMIAIQKVQLFPETATIGREDMTFDPGDTMKCRETTITVLTSHLHQE